MIICKSLMQFSLKFAFDLLKPCLTMFHHVGNFCDGSDSLQGTNHKPVKWGQGDII